MRGDPRLPLDPGCDLAPRPELPFKRRRLQRLEERLLELGRQEGGSTGIVGAGIAQASWPSDVVALHESADSFVTQAGKRRSDFGRVSLGDQP